MIFLRKLVAQASAAARGRYTPAALLLCTLSFSLSCVSAQGLIASDAGAQSATTGSPAKAIPVTVTKPSWSELTATQREALAPLATSWPTITVAQKRKWLALSQNFDALAMPDQRIMHRRMADWAALSTQQRAQARLNFAQARDVPAQQRVAHWETYQALSTEQKQKLAAASQTLPAGAAPAMRPVAPNKLTITPTAVQGNGSVTGGKPTPRIATQAHQVDRQTLLPQTVQFTVPVPFVEGETDNATPASGNLASQ